MSAAVVAVAVGGCVLGEPPKPPADCWFAQGVPIGFNQATTLGELGMGGPDGRWNQLPVYAWVTADSVDLWGTGELTRAICVEVIDQGAEGDAFREESGGVVWNSWPIGQVPQRGRDD